MLTSTQRAMLCTSGDRANNDQRERFPGRRGWTGGAGRTNLEGGNRDRVASVESEQDEDELSGVPLRRLDGPRRRPCL